MNTIILKRYGLGVRLQHKLQLAPKESEMLPLSRKTSRERIRTTYFRVSFSIRLGVFVTLTPSAYPNILELSRELDVLG